MGALRAQDFDALALTADTWIGAHGDLRRIVIHPREFPGWENPGASSGTCGLRDHHRRVRRIALAADSKLASLASRVGEHFVQAEVRTFGYDDLANAVAWAGDATAQSARP